MKITIDTAQDSKEELKKLIALLTALVNEPVHSNSNDVFEQEGSSGLNAFAAMFGSSGSVEKGEGVANKLKNKVEVVPY